MNPLTADLAYWIMERHAIKERRVAGLGKPWSGDPIFQSVRFCNVHREDDAVTQWIRAYWNRAHDPAWKFVLGRMINLPNSLDACRVWSRVEDIKEQLKDHRARGHKVFTAAYTISTCGKPMDKLDYVFDHVVQAVMEAGEPEYETCEGVQKQLTCIDGLGSFLSAQVIADMKNTVGHPLAEAPDFWTFSAPGPGSLRGLSWYFYGEPTGVTSGKYAHCLRVCRREVDPLIHGMRMISDQDFQNCLCEFSKYMKRKRNPGAHVRNNYPGV